MISTRELAKIAGVSQATVSRSLNDHPAISAETKERIRSLAKEYGYIQQRKSRKTLLTTQRRAIGILVMNQPFFKDLFINHMMNLLNTIISKENYYAIPLLDFTVQSGAVNKIKDLLKTGLIAGFIIINREYDAQLDAYLNKIGLPHVYLLHCARDSFQSINIIDADNYYGGYLGTRYLIRYGHRNIVTIAAPWREYEDRTDGYHKALREYGIQPDERNILCCNSNYDDGYQIITDHIELFPTATAVYAQNDLLAFGAINALKDAGFRVPEDISVVGNDGYDLGVMCRPKIDSVAHPTEELARLSVSRLLEISDSSGKHIPRQIILQPYMISRGSVTYGPALPRHGKDGMECRI